MRRLFAFPLIMLCLILTSSKAQAQVPDFSLGINPPIIEIEATPPTHAQANITLYNLNSVPHDLRIELRSFKFSDKKNGEIEYLEGNAIQGPDALIFQKIVIFEEDQNIYGAQNAPKTFKIGPNEIKKLRLVVNIEDGAPIGDYYFSVIFISNDNNSIQSSGSTAPSGIATNVILSVGEKGEPNGEITSFKSPFFFDQGPVPFTLLLSNKSDHFVVPRGKIDIKNIFGKTVGEINILPQYILSNSSRFMLNTDQASPSSALQDTLGKLKPKTNILVWNEKYLFGLYTAKVTVALSETGPILTSSSAFIAFPISYVVAFAFIVLIMAGIYLRVKKKI